MKRRPEQPSDEGWLGTPQKRTGEFRLRIVRGGPIPETRAQVNTGSGFAKRCLEIALAARSQKAQRLGNPVKF